MDPRRLLIFRAVARAGSISAAARELGWTQPAVSQHLRALEREAGTPLTMRDTRGVRLTDAGRLLLSRADAVAAELHLAEEELAAIAHLRRGRVRLAAYPSALATLVPQAVSAIGDQAAELEITLVDAEPPEALDLLEQGAVDLAVIFGYQQEANLPNGLVWQAFGNEPVFLIVPGTSPYATGPVRLEDLAEAAWIVGCARCRSHLLQLCAEAGFEPIERHSTDDYVVRQNLVGAGLGVTLLPAAALAAYRNPGVAVRHDHAYGQRSIGVAFREGADLVPANAMMIKELQSTFSAASTTTDV